MPYVLIHHQVHVPFHLKIINEFFWEVDNYVEDVTSGDPEFHHLKSHRRKLRLDIVILFILLRTISTFSIIALQVLTALYEVFTHTD